MLKRIKQFKIKDQVPNNGLTLADVVALCLVYADFNIDEQVFNKLPEKFKEFFEAI